MSRSDLNRAGFLTTYVLPAVLIFFIPFCGWLFFRHARSILDESYKKQIIEEISADEKLTPNRRAERTRFFSETPLSQIIKHEQSARQFDASIQIRYWTIEWMIALSEISLIGGLILCLFSAALVGVALYSEFAQYVCFLVGRHTLTIYGAVQTVLNGILAVGLSYWVTALWMGVYSPWLVILAMSIAGAGCAVVIYTLFSLPDQRHSVNGAALNLAEHRSFVAHVASLCDRMEVNPPDQIIAGIDDNFFVTEMPLEVRQRRYEGRTLYVSLALLKYLSGGEADAVLAHEIAHFQARDTMYSKRMTPLLAGFEDYLQGLCANPFSLPVFLYMRCFRALFAVSIGRHSRNREFRADTVAATVVAPRDLAAAILRITAYSLFRQQIEQSLFEVDAVLETAEIGRQVETDFPVFASHLAANGEFLHAETTHPFDTHPPTRERIRKLAVDLDADEIRSILVDPRDAERYRDITGAKDLELRLWTEYEQAFRMRHERTLAFRFLPQTDEEREVVQRQFPEQVFEGRAESLVVNCETIRASSWSDAVKWSEVMKFTLNDNVYLHVEFSRSGSRDRTIQLSKFAAADQARILAMTKDYRDRYLSAAEYQRKKSLSAQSG